MNEVTPLNVSSLTPCVLSLQLGPNVSIGKGVTIGAGVRVRESIILHGASLQVGVPPN